MKLDSRDVDGAIGILGLALLGYGLLLWWAPAAYMVVGATLFGLAIWRLR